MIVRHACALLFVRNLLPDRPKGPGDCLSPPAELTLYYPLITAVIKQDQCKSGRPAANPAAFLRGMPCMGPTDWAPKTIVRRLALTELGICLSSIAERILRDLPKKDRPTWMSGRAESESVNEPSEVAGCRPTWLENDATIRPKASRPKRFWRRRFSP